MSEETGPSGRRNIMILAGVWIVLAAAGVLWGIPRIEANVEANVAEAVNNPAIRVSASGRDVVLSSATSDASLELARRTAEGVSGVRSVTIDQDPTAQSSLAVNPGDDKAPHDPVLVDPTVIVTVRRSAVFLDGSVADPETRDALLAAAIAAFGEDRVVNELGVDADTLSPSWLDDPFPLMAAIGPHELGVEIYDKTLRLTGAVPDTAAQAEAVAAVEAHVGDDLTVQDRLVIVPIEDPVFQMQSNIGSVTLRGALPTQIEINSIRASAEQIYGSESVATWMEVDEAAPAIPYLTDSAAFFRSFEGRTLDFVDTGNALVVSGFVPSQEIADSIGETLAEVVAPRVLTNELVVVEIDDDTQAAITAINDIIGSSLKFGSGSTSLSDDDREKLDEVAAILNDSPSLRAVVEGHTDDAGGELGNQRLSEERARSVVVYLESVGIDPNRLSTIGFGEERPIASNGTSAGRSQNRRIEFNVEGSR